MNNQEFLMNLMRQRDPRSAVLSMLESQASGNPMFAMLLNLGKNNQGQQIETIARNICKEKGKDFDKEFSTFKQMLGI